MTCQKNSILIRALVLLAVGWLFLPHEARAQTPFLGEVRWVAFTFAPRGWATCSGQTLPINQNQALFSLLGTTFGGNGTTTFNLPDLRSRAPVHAGNGFVLGQMGGEEGHTLSAGELPAHTHALLADPREGNTASPVGGTPAKTGAGTPAFSGQANATMAADSISSVGGSQPHDNMKPYLAMTCIIALQGIFPSQ